MEDIKRIAQSKTTLADDDWLVAQSDSAGLGQMFKIKAVNALPAAPPALITSGEGSPEEAVAAPVGALYVRTDGGASTTLYVKESGTGNTGWIAK
jgi:hypothetical protein